MAGPAGETAAALRPRAAPLESAEGRVVALLDIGKMRGDEYIDRLAEIFGERGIQVRRFRKPTNTKVAPRQLLDEIADAADAVVVALSD